MIENVVWGWKTILVNLIDNDSHIAVAMETWLSTMHRMMMVVNGDKICGVL